MNFTKRSGAVALLSLAFGLACRMESDHATDRPGRSRAEQLGVRLERILAKPFDPATRGGELEALFAEADADDGAVLRTHFMAASPYAHPSDLQHFAWWWASRDPVEAMRTPIATSTATLDFWQIQVLRAWAGRSPEAAHEAWQGGACQGAQDYCLLALVVGWAESGDKGVWPFVMNLTPGVLGQRAMDALAARLIADRGVDDAIRFAEAIDPDAPNRFKLQFFRRMATAIALRDLERAASFAEEHSNGPFGDGLLRRVAVQMVMQAGARGMEWLTSLSPGAQRDDAVEAASYRWIQSDRSAAMRWFGQAEDRPALQPAWRNYSQALVDEDPRRALAIVDRIDDVADRDGALVSVLQLWLARSPVDANDWIEQSELPEERVAQIRAEPVTPGVKVRRRP